ncbi:MAG TPA: Mut7-C RNAse domain-containing protein, partial [Flavisolibacter sp.]
QPHDFIDVMPFETTAKSPSPLAFVLDVHLGKLARLLRLLGFNTHYQTDYDDARIVALAQEQNSVVLTRDVGLLKHKVLQYGYWLRSQHPEEQLKEVVSRFALCDKIRPFSRCIACNGFIEKVEKVTIQDSIPPGTRAYFHEFYRCGQCHKIYWKGSHYQKMLHFLERLRSFACQVGPPAL